MSRSMCMYGSSLSFAWLCTICEGICRGGGVVVNEYEVYQNVAVSIVCVVLCGFPAEVARICASHGDLHICIT